MPDERRWHAGNFTCVKRICIFNWFVQNIDSSYKIEAIKYEPAIILVSDSPALKLLQQKRLCASVIAIIILHFYAGKMQRKYWNFIWNVVNEKYSILGIREFLLHIRVQIIVKSSKALIWNQRNLNLTKEILKERKQNEKNSYIFVYSINFMLKCLRG